MQEHDKNNLRQALATQSLMPHILFRDTNQGDYQMTLRFIQQSNADGGTYLRQREASDFWEKATLIETLEFAAWFIQQNCEGGTADRATQNIATVIRAAKR